VKTALALLLIHALYWGLGALLLKRGSSSYRLGSARGPHWFAAYFLGLSLNTVIVFTANQFFHVQLTLFSICLVAFACIGCASFLPYLGREEIAPAARPSELWAPASTITLLFITVIFVAIHSFIFWHPLDAWDSFLYHLPYGRMVAAGGFPTNFGPSYNLQMEASYPPLFYFLYGLNAFVETPDVTFLAPKVTAVLVDGVICLATYRLARDRFALPRLPALVAILCLVVMLARKPSMHSFTMVFFVLALYYLWPVAEGDSSQMVPRSRWIGALLLGGCCWANYLGLPLAGLFIAGLGALCLWSRWRGVESPDSLAELSMLALGIGLMLTPFLLRNWLFTGNPIYPAMLDTLGGVGATDWFLENHTMTAPQEVGWSSLPEIFRRSYPASGLLLAAVVAVAVPRSIAISSRIPVGVMLVGFLVVWIGVLQLDHAPIKRYIHPMLPLAAIAVTAHLWNVAGRSWHSMLEFGSYATAIVAAHYAQPLIGTVPLIAYITFTMLVLVIAVVMAPGDAPVVFERTRQLRFLMAAPLLGALCIRSKDLQVLLTEHLGTMATILGLIAGAVLLIGSIAWMKWRRTREAGLQLRLRSRTVFAIALVAALATTSRDVHLDELNGYQLEIAESLAWINTNLPTDARIMTMEDRLFLLDRAFVPADDWRLERFYKARSPQESMKILKDFGITHVYFSGVYFERDFPPFRAKDFLWADEDNDYIRVVHRSNNARIVELQLNTYN